MTFDDVRSHYRGNGTSGIIITRLFLFIYSSAFLLHYLRKNFEICIFSFAPSSTLYIFTKSTQLHILFMEFLNISFFNFCPARISIRTSVRHPSSVPVAALSVRTETNSTSTPLPCLTTNFIARLKKLFIFKRINFFFNDQFVIN